MFISQDSIISCSALVPNLGVVNQFSGGFQRAQLSYKAALKYVVGENVTWETKHSERA